MSVAKETKSEYLLNGMLLWQNYKRFQNYCAEISKANSIFCSCREVNRQDSSISLEEMQSMFQENAFLLFKSLAKPYLYYTLPNSSQRPKGTNSLPELKAR